MKVKALHLVLVVAATLGVVAFAALDAEPAVIDPAATQAAPVVGQPIETEALRDQLASLDRSGADAPRRAWSSHAAGVEVDANHAGPWLTGRLSLPRSITMQIVVESSGPIVQRHRFEVGADGTFRVPVPPRTSVVLRLAEPGHLFLETGTLESRSIRIGAGSVEVSLGLERALSIRGRVVDSDGRPVPDAAISMVQAGLLSTAVAERRASSDQHGEFEVTGLARVSYELAIVSPESGSLVQVLRPSHRTPRSNYELKRGHGIVGRILDDRGEPLEGLGVVAVVASKGVNAVAFLGEAAVPSKTDAAGRFRVGIPAGAKTIFVRVQGSGYCSMCFRVEEPGAQGVALELPQAGRIVGRIAPAPSVSCARVTASLVRGRMWNAPIAARTEVAVIDGSFELTGLLPGTWELRTPGGRPILVEVDSRAPTTVRM